MKQFMNGDFFLGNETAIRLYHDYAKHMPIFDYHCHLSPKEIYENKRYKNITELWLGGDHYKWRGMRINGIDESYITGNGDDKEKFMKWAQTMPYCIGNPLYIWTHLELKRYFGIDTVLSPETAEEIWNKCNEMLQQDGFTTREFIKRSNVKAICTTDDPLDSLEYHAAIAKDDTFDIKVLPTFRPDKGINIEKEGFTNWIGKLQNITGVEIKDINDLYAALTLRIQFFHINGCRLSDHALEPVVYCECSDAEATGIFLKAMDGKVLSEEEIQKYKTSLIVFLGKQYYHSGWTMQIHTGCLRNNNSRMMQRLGPDTGFDAIADSVFAQSLSRLLNRLDQSNELPKTILYCLNPRDNEVLGTIAGCFQGDGIPGKIQFGTGWWFNDQKDGMERQMTALANLGLLSRFVGMLTDSRSFLSYTRHEYFRRILCNMIGEWVENGEAPNDMILLKKMVQDICFNNAKEYFGIVL